jgi:transcriptional regulator with XRE-family HTH domain
VENELQVRVGRRIAEARHAKGLSQRELALLTGNAIRTIQTWEADERHPRPETLARVAAATDRSLSWFYETDDEPVAA